MLKSHRGLYDSRLEMYRTVPTTADFVGVEKNTHKIYDMTNFFY